MEEDFYATIKFKNGEEIFCKVAPSEEDERTMLIISNPIQVSEVKAKGGVVGYKVEPWLKTTQEDMFIVNMDNVLTMSESNDVEMIIMHQSFVRDTIAERNDESPVNRKMGYLGKVSDTKEILEKIFKNNTNPKES